jgi:hypothetical protein
LVVARACDAVRDWNQASLLAQIGLLDPTGLLIVVNHAAKILDPSLAK